MSLFLKKCPWDVSRVALSMVVSLLLQWLFMFIFAKNMAISFMIYDDDIAGEHLFLGRLCVGKMTKLLWFDHLRLANLNKYLKRCPLTFHLIWLGLRL